MQTVTPWGTPYDPNAGASWMQQYGAWVLIGALVVLALATANDSGKGHHAK